MPQRQLDFADVRDVFAELDRLQRGGYEKVGQWDLAQVCDHLAYFIEGSLDGHTYRVPWIFKVLFGRLVLRGILKKRPMKWGSPDPAEAAASGGRG